MTRYGTSQRRWHGRVRRGSCWKANGRIPMRAGWRESMRKGCGGICKTRLFMNDERRRKLAGREHDRVDRRCGPVHRRCFAMVGQVTGKDYLLLGIPSRNSKSYTSMFFAGISGAVETSGCAAHWEERAGATTNSATPKALLPPNSRVSKGAALRCRRREKESREQLDRAAGRTAVKKSVDLTRILLDSFCALRVSCAALTHVDYAILSS